ncbi:MAG: adenylyl-sulfate kinase [Myxococcota bacterium]|nr:adenylyl-sulfate kinase [Myxococcota bacterium]
MNSRGCTVWVTGLPASGKRTLAQSVGQELAQRGVAHELIDSGKLRETLLGNTIGFSREERNANCHRNAFVATLLAKNGVIAVVSSVSPYRATRDAIRAESGDFVEVWVSTPKAVCIDRDEKGMWAKALAGEIHGFTGVDAPYEPPEHAEVTVDLSHTSVDSAVTLVLQALEERGYLQADALEPTSDTDPAPQGFGYAD